MRAAILVDAAGAWADDVAARAGVAPIGLQPMRRTVVQLRVGREGLRDLPQVTDLLTSFYFKGEGDRSIWVSPLDETPVDPCDAAPEEIDVACHRPIRGRGRLAGRGGREQMAGLRSFTPDRMMKFGFDSLAPGFFWCVGQGGMGIQTAPAASLLSPTLIRGEPLPKKSSPASTPPTSRRAKRARSNARRRVAHPPPRRRGRRRGRFRDGRCGP